MSTPFDLLAGQGWDLLAQQQGEAIIYHPAGGEDVAATAIVEDLGTRKREMGNGTRVARHLRVRVPVGGDGVGTPGPDDRLTWCGDLYAVVEVLESGGATATLDVGRWTDGEDHFEGLREVLLF